MAIDSLSIKLNVWNRRLDSLFNSNSDHAKQLNIIRREQDEVKSEVCQAVQSPDEIFRLVDENIAGGTLGDIDYKYYRDNIYVDNEKFFKESHIGMCAHLFHYYTKEILTYVEDMKSKRKANRHKKNLNKYKETIPNKRGIWWGHDYWQEGELLVVDGIPRKHQQCIYYKGGPFQKFIEYEPTFEFELCLRISRLRKAEETSLETLVKAIYLYIALSIVAKDIEYLTGADVPTGIVETPKLVENVEEVPVENVEEVSVENVEEKKTKSDKDFPPRVKYYIQRGIGNENIKVLDDGSYRWETKPIRSFIVFFMRAYHKDSPDYEKLEGMFDLSNLTQNRNSMIKCDWYEDEQNRLHNKPPKDGQAYKNPPQWYIDIDAFCADIDIDFENNE